MAFLDVVHEAVREHQAQQQLEQPHDSSSPELPPDSDIANANLSTNNDNNIQDSKPPPTTTTSSALNHHNNLNNNNRRRSSAAHYRDSSLDSQNISPATRSGPPRSLSYNYYTPSAAAPRQNITSHNNDLNRAPGTHADVDQTYGDGFPFPFENGSAFRGALDSTSPTDRKGKQQQRRPSSKLQEEPWTLNHKRWLADSPKESPLSSPVINKKRELDDSSQNVPGGDEETGEKADAAGAGPSSIRQQKQQQPGPASDNTTIATTQPPSSSSAEYHRQRPQEIRTMSSEPARSLSQPPTSRANRPGLTKWNRLRSILLPNLNPQHKSSGVAAVSGTQVNITDELMVSGLSTLMLRLWFDRDEKDHRRVPVLLQRLRIRVSDSLHPLHGSKAVFRIECEYANGAARWVIYRQLRDFISLHTHYKFSNALSRNADKLPEFPKTSVPYFKFLQKQRKENGEHGHIDAAEFARMQRVALENYLLDLIRAVMMHPSANRLAGFFEISALSIALAQSGGSQYKAGVLRIEAANNKGGGFGRKSTGWREKKKSRWCAVRESYLVVMEESGELDVWDVFMLDPDFSIERPKRYYRQGFGLLQGDKDDESDDEHGNGLVRAIDRQEHTAKIAATVRNKVAGALRIGGRRRAASESALRGIDHDVRQIHDDIVSLSSNSSLTSLPSNAGGNMRIDPSTNVNPLEMEGGGEQVTVPRTEKEKKKQQKSTDVSKHTFYIENSQMRLKLFAKNERQMLQWITALERAAEKSHYTGGNRFDSFAPIRLDVAAQWLVDGRDYMWNLSRAILLARETIYIHDWWLSPELQMRRPGQDKYRLDNLLKRKAEEGVKIHVILYQEVSSRTTPTESSYTKQRLTNLHPNIMVQRSPSHFQTGTFYWAHHEKMCVIDEAIAFMGGVDLCFGRWDTPQHALVDDPDPDSDIPQIWPGKDYSNPRIQDFYNLSHPEEDMYDRSKIPRMPWHDVGMQIVGQPARDLARHFVQRWNYLLRIKNHSRVMPFLLPPPEFRPGELSRMGLTGTCEIQICRSAGPWSLGTPNRIEHSIQNAYLKAIQMSEHFVYIENQFFITSTTVNEVKIENKIGDAIVHRIIRAHREKKPWKCCIVIPLLPGFAYPVDHTDASAVRIILECQNRTICRGPESIFGRVKEAGIEPNEYISVFSLRNWAKLRDNVLTTEMVYIHGKTCIVDDRLAIIGSANINERSQRGDRDSELAAIIRDTDMIDSTMAGKPFKVGRFAHTLRVRLMREHLGIDVDAMEEEDLMANDPVQAPEEQKPWDPESEQRFGQEGVTRVKKSKQRTPVGQIWHDATDAMQQAIHGTEDAGSKDVVNALHKLGIKPKNLDSTAGEAALKEERQMYTSDGKKEPGFASSQVPTLEEKLLIEHRPPAEAADSEPLSDKVDMEKTSDKALSTIAEAANGESSGNGSLVNSGKNLNGNDALSASSTSKEQEQHRCSGDPCTQCGKMTIIKTVEQRAAESNEPEPPQARTADGELYGTPAHAAPSAREDSEVPHSTADGHEGGGSDEEKLAQGARKLLRKHVAAPVTNTTWSIPVPRPKIDKDDFEDPISDAFWKDKWVAAATHNTEIYRKVFHAVPDDEVTSWKQYMEFVVHHERLNKPYRDDPTPHPIGRVPSETDDSEALGQNKAEISQAEKPAASEINSGGGGGGAGISGAGSSSTDGEKESKTGGAARKATIGGGGNNSNGGHGVEPFSKEERDAMEKLLEDLCGHLVVYPTRFLEREDDANNFLFNADRLLPLPIYD